MTRRGISIAACIGLLSAINSVALAQAPINACVHNQSGAIRIVTSSSCRAEETPLTWNGTGGGVAFYTVQRETFMGGPLTLTSIGLGCENGDEVISGGYQHSRDQPDIRVLASFPALNQAGVAVGWNFEIQNFSETRSYELAIYIRCVRVGTGN
jgi:hypothetical protein